MAIETTVIIGLVLFVISEVLPYLPIKSNGIIQAVLGALRVAFPHKSDTDK